VTVLRLPNTGCLDGARADEQAGGDLGVGLAAADQGQHLLLAFGQALDLSPRLGRLGPVGELGHEAAGDDRRDQRVADGDHADRGQDVLQRHVLDQEPARPGAQRGVGKALANLAAQLYTAKA
jgi:hypothetical protein